MEINFRGKTYRFEIVREGEQAEEQSMLDDLQDQEYDEFRWP